MNGPLLAVTVALAAVGLVLLIGTGLGWVEWTNTGRRLQQVTLGPDDVLILQGDVAPADLAAWLDHLPQLRGRVMVTDETMGITVAHIAPPADHHAAPLAGARP